MWADWEWCDEHGKPRWDGSASCRELHPFAATLAPWCYACERVHGPTDWGDGCLTEGEALNMDTIEVPSELIEALRNANQEIKRLTDTATAIKELIKRTMGQCEYATVDGEPAVRWAHVRSRRLDMDALRANVDPVVLAGCYVDEVNRRFIALTSSKAKS